MNPKLSKWLKWLDVIHKDVRNLKVAQRNFWEIQNLIEANKNLHIENDFFRYIAESYVSHAVMSIRRQIKVSDENSISFAKLLQEIIDNPDVLSRNYYVSLYKGSYLEDLADSDFNKFSEPRLECVKASLICTDLQQLKVNATGCEHLADRRIAHIDSRSLKKSVTFNELDKAIDTMDELFVKYYLLFHAKKMDTVLPVRQYDWQKIFTIPWIQPPKM